MRQDMASRLTRNLLQEKRIPKLSQRELEVLHLAGAGKSAKEIGRLLGGISNETVNTHKKKIVNKFKATHNTRGEVGVLPRFHGHLREGRSRP